MGIEIRLTKPLPTRQPSYVAPSLKEDPWAIQTASGADCVLASGAGPRPIHGQGLNYFCGSSSSPGAIGLWGYPNRASQPWTIFSAPGNATVLSHRVAILHAWM
jgi:hypothetical protein